MIDGQKILSSTDGAHVKTDINGKTYLIIDTLKFSDVEHQISITAQNNLGVAKTGAYLTINEQLELTQKLVDQTVEKGQSALFKAQIKNAKPTYNFINIYIKGMISNIYTLFSKIF